MNRKNFKLNHKVPLILIGTLLLAAISFCWFGYRVIENTKQNVINNMELELARIERNLFDTIEYTNSLTNAINIRIAQDPYNKNHINNVLTTYNDDEKLNQTLSWTLFSWVDSDAKLTVDAKYGILKEPINCSEFEDVVKSEQQPRIFHLGSPKYGATSKKLIIPAAMGLLDKNGKYAGATVIGFETSRLGNILHNSIKNPNISFRMLSEKGVTILNGNFTNFKSGAKIQTENEIKDEYVAKIINNLNYKNSKKHSEINIFNNPRAILIKKSDNYPYFFILSYDKNSIKKEFATSVINNISEALSIIFSFLILLFLIYREISQTKKSIRLKIVAQRANKSKLEFLIKAAHEFKNFIFAIHGCAEIIKDDLNKIKQLSTKDKSFEKLKNYHDISTDIDLTKDIIEASHDLDNFINELIDLNYGKDSDIKINPSVTAVDVAQIIKNAISSLNKRSQNAEIKLSANISSNLHEIEKIDPKILKRVIVSLISNSIKHSKDGSVVTIDASNIDDEKTLKNIHKIHGIKKEKAIEIIIRDQGFGINQKEIRASLQRISSFKNIDILTTRLPSIKSLIERQGGVFEVRSNVNDGNEFRIIL
jgi:signal transduction histidine kinase